MDKMDQFYPAKGIGVSRYDVAKYVYEMQDGMTNKEACAKAARLTNKQMERIAASFSESFFEMRAGTIHVDESGCMYPCVIQEAYRWLREDSGDWTEP